MGTKILGVILAAIVFVACGTQPESLGTNPGSQSEPQFRDLTFGQAPTSDMVPAGADSGLPCYARPSDDRSAGSGQLSSLKYCFYNNQLLDVVAETKGLVNSQALLQTLQAKYGEGEQPNEFIPLHHWGLFSPLYWSKRLDIIYNQNLVTDDATVLYESAAVSAERDAAKGKAASNAASQF